MEIEAKFRVDDRAVFDRVLMLSILGDATLSPQPQPEFQHTIYYDTFDESLRTHGASLRVREIDGQRIATVKRSRGATGGLHIRDEWETLIGIDVHPHSWPLSAARERALALVGTRRLLPQLSVHTRRHRVDVARRGRQVAELCLDEGHIRAGGRVVGFRELEVELQGDGTPEDLMQLCRWLQNRFPLTPEPLGKRSRGLALRATIAADRWSAPAGIERAVGG